jgi:NAD(P)-dependent dehydrogenase (short-subunit alcohol dehydrogenase family)
MLMGTASPTTEGPTTMPHHTDLTIPDLTRRRALVTGASDGMGVVIATRLAQAGAELVLPVRTAAKGAAVAQRIREQAPGATIDLRALDLASLDSVAALVDELVAEARPLHLLINNAGVMDPPQRQESADGFELQLAVNHLGHVALTLGLLPLLREGGARVTHQTSIAARNGAINWDDLNWERSYDSAKAYGQSKLAGALFARELDARSRASGWGISSNLAHPGVSPTNLLAAQPKMGRQSDRGARRVIRLLSRIGLTGTVPSAAAPALLAATGPDSEGDRFYGPRRTLAGRPVPIELWKPMRDMDAAARLWEVSERLVRRA